MVPPDTPLLFDSFLAGRLGRCRTWLANIAGRHCSADERHGAVGLTGICFPISNAQRGNGTGGMGSWSNSRVDQTATHQAPSHWAFEVSFAKTRALIRRGRLRTHCPFLLIYCAPYLTAYHHARCYDTIRYTVSYTICYTICYLQYCLNLTVGLAPEMESWRDGRGREVERQRDREIERCRDREMETGERRVGDAS